MSVTTEQVQDIIKRLSDLETEKANMLDSILTLQRDNIRFQKDVFQTQKENDSLKKRVEGLESREDELSKDNSKLQQMLNSTMKELQEGKEQINQFNKVGALAKRTDDIEEMLTHKSQSATSVEISRVHPLLKGKRLPVDHCVKVIQNSGFFDTNACCLDPLVDGAYAINVVFRQRGKGMLRIFAKVDNGDDFYVGKTAHHNDISSTMRVWRLNAGQKILFEILLEEGDASLRWCNVYIWLF